MEKSLSTGPPDGNKQSLKFTSYHIPLLIEEENISVSLQREGNLWHYHRESAGETVDKTLLAADDGRILLNPVEPVNRPKEITQYYLVEFEQSLTIKPRETSEVAVTFPVEIGAFYLADDQAHTVLDIFSFIKPKYTLYGTPTKGLICRYWKSRIHQALPAPNPLLEGVMRIGIRNTTSRWIELSKAVFNVHEMSIYYSGDLVFAAAYLKIISENAAETGFDNIPLHKDMEKSLELFASRKNLVTASRLVMEEGL